MKTILTPTYPAPLSRVCLGTAALAQDGLTGVHADHAYAILDAYYALGGRFLDTASIYGWWGKTNTNASEQIIGRWLRDRAATDVTVLTKACHHDPANPTVSRVDAAALTADAERSRRALGQDTLDILLLHRDNPAMDVREIVDFCVPLVDQGRAIRFGFSNFRADRVQDALDYMGDDWQRYFFGVSNEWSLAMDGAMEYTPADGMVPTDAALRELRAARAFVLLPYSSVAHGFFDKLRACGAVYDGAWQNTDAFRGNHAWLTPANGDAYNRLLAESAASGQSLTMRSLAYMLAQPGTIPVMSASRVAQVEELAKIL